MFKVGEILNKRYQLQQLLGHTAPGHQTWLSIDLECHEQVTIKLLAFSQMMQWEELKLFEREVQVLQALNHPRIPRYRDYFNVDQNTGEGVLWFALVQDYISGSSLQELLDQGKHFSEKQIRIIAAAVLKILIYLHELSPPVLHRDIKPSNLILGEDKRIYLIDFGAVQAQAATTGVTFTIVGTSGYAPLEQFWGRAVPASDIYALGATLIHLLTGIVPSDLPQKDSQIQFVERVSLKAGLISWVEKATEAAIEKRFSSAREALKVLKSTSTEFLPAPRVRAKRKIAKPYFTRVQVNESDKILEIYIPPSWRTTLLVTGLSFGWGIIIFGMNGVLHVATVGALVFFLLFLLVYLGRNTHIYLGFNKFRVEYQTLGLTYRRTEGNTNQILGVFTCQNRYGYYVKIYSKHKDYFLTGALNEEDCVWLAQKIQNWLHI